MGPCIPYLLSRKVNRLPLCLLEARKDLAVKLWVRLPGLTGYELAVANGLRSAVGATARFNLIPNMFVCRELDFTSKPRSYQDLNAVANCEHPLVLVVKFLDKVDQMAIIPQVFGGSTAKQEYRLVLGNNYGLK